MKTTKSKKQPVTPRKTNKESSVVLGNNRGQKMHLRGSTTIRELVAMGATRIRLVPVGAPLEDGEWKDLSATRGPSR